MTFPEYWSAMLAKRPALTRPDALATMTGRSLKRQLELAYNAGMAHQAALTKAAGEFAKIVPEGRSGDLDELRKMMGM